MNVEVFSLRRYATDSETNLEGKLYLNGYYEGGEGKRMEEEYITYLRGGELTDGVIHVASRIKDYETLFSLSPYDIISCAHRWNDPKLLLGLMNGYDGIYFIEYMKTEPENNGHILVTALKTARGNSPIMKAYRNADQYSILLPRHGDIVESHRETGTYGNNTIALVERVEEGAQVSEQDIREVFDMKKGDIRYFSPLHKYYDVDPWEFIDRPITYKHHLKLLGVVPDLSFYITRQNYEGVEYCKQMGVEGFSTEDIDLTDPDILLPYPTMYKNYVFRYDTRIELKASEADKYNLEYPRDIIWDSDEILISMEYDAQVVYDVYKSPSVSVYKYLYDRDQELALKYLQEQEVDILKLPARYIPPTHYVEWVKSNKGSKEINEIFRKLDEETMIKLSWKISKAIRETLDVPKELYGLFRDYNVLFDLYDEGFRFTKMHNAKTMDVHLSYADPDMTAEEFKTLLIFPPKFAMYKNRRLFLRHLDILIDRYPECAIQFAKQSPALATCILPEFAVRGYNVNELVTAGADLHYLDDVLLSDKFDLAMNSSRYLEYAKQKSPSNTVDLFIESEVCPIIS